MVLVNPGEFRHFFHHISEKSLYLFGIMQPLSPQPGAAMAKTGKNAHEENRHIKSIVCRLSVES